MIEMRRTYRVPLSEGRERKTARRFEQFLDLDLKKKKIRTPSHNDRPDQYPYSFFTDEEGARRKRQEG